MSQPLRLLSSPAQAAAILGRFARPDRAQNETSYATVADFCESVDQLAQIAPLDGDLKNVQRPWAAKTIIAHVPPPARLLEIGGGEPIVCGFLGELGYQVTLVDPYDGAGNGPTDYERYRALFPHVKIIRDYFRPDLGTLAPRSFDAIFSISVLEHIPPDGLVSCFDAIGEFLAPTGVSIHCFDFILQGPGDTHDYVQAQQILAQQARITGVRNDTSFNEFLQELASDVETFFLSPQGHHNWRGGRAYSNFPFRKVVSLQTVARRQQT